MLIADAPNTADWLEAWATAAGAVMSTATVAVALLVIFRDRRQRRVQERVDRMAQARLVVVEERQAFFAIAQGDVRQSTASMYLDVWNHSGAPIFHVKPYLVGHYAENSGGRTYVSTIAPGEKDSVLWLDTRDAVESIEPRVEFVDRQGLKWVVTEGGEVKPEEELGAGGVLPPEPRLPAGDEAST